MTHTRINQPERTEIPIDYPPAPDGRVLYVIGDIHGRRDLLVRVHELIDQNKARARNVDPFELAGPGSAPVLLVKPREYRADRPANTSAMSAESAAQSDVRAVPSAIGPDPTIRGRIQAKGEVFIEGHALGHAYATPIVLRSGVKADVWHESLVVGDGCHFEDRSCLPPAPLSACHNASISSQGTALEVYLGDYIDRGDDSRGVVDLLIERARHTKAVFVRGNHEQFMLDFLAGTLDFSIWKQAGGLPTLRSYGVQTNQFVFSKSQSTLRSSLGKALPQEHARFFADTVPYFVAGRYLFVHAGLRPGIPLEQQQPEDLLGIRRPFLDFDGKFEHTVVHGHTPVRAPVFKHNQINLDTGAFRTGRLTCLRIGPEGPQLLED